jgi:membrane-bound metal-dependent hydrolase YbcI (DUF457 family)
MKFPEHVAISYLLAQFGCQQQYGPGGTVLMILAGNLPDLDTLTLFAGYRAYRKYHRIVGHGLPVTLVGPALLAAAGAFLFNLGPLLPLWGCLQLAHLMHVLMDVLFYRWPVQLLWPFSSRGWAVGLLTWNDLTPTLLLYAASVVALIWPAAGPYAATAGIGGLAFYLTWRVYEPQPRTHWEAWLMGNWAVRSAPIWRWLTGDFLS